MPDAPPNARTERRTTLVTRLTDPAVIGPVLAVLVGKILAAVSTGLTVLAFQILGPVGSPNPRPPGCLQLVKAVDKIEAAEPEILDTFLTHSRQHLAEQCGPDADQQLKLRYEHAGA